jgi:hypothetical protein
MAFHSLLPTDLAVFHYFRFMSFSLLEHEVSAACLYVTDECFVVIADSDILLGEKIVLN